MSGFDWRKSIVIPSSIFQDRELSVLEVMVEYFKEKKGMKYAEIGRLLNRDERTIWTAYKRGNEKRRAGKGKGTKTKRDKNKKTKKKR